MKHETGLTAPDDIPPVHVLEAAQHQERKEAENLLAGFDRPGRGPKKPSAQRDFVDYYAKRKGGRDSGRGPSSAPLADAAERPPRQMDVSTVVKPRKTKDTPVWVVWAALALFMVFFGGTFAWFAVGETRPAPGMHPSVTTTISAATAPQPSGRDVIPPPVTTDPATLTTTPLIVTEPAPAPAVAPARPAGRRDARPAQSSPSMTAPAGDNKPPPRDDFLRDL